jgi:low affinity Fe/Cu permease
MVFLIQATQNRDSKAIHLKLDELLRAISKARTGLVGLEDMDEEDVKRIEADFAAIKARQARRLQEKSQHVNGNGSFMLPSTPILAAPDTSSRAS